MKPPTEQEVADWLKEMGIFDVKAEKFWWHYEGTGWHHGQPTKELPYGKPMLSWKAKIYTVWTKTTKAQRKLWLMGKCECGCGKRPKKLIDGKGYYNEFCLDKVKKKLEEPLDTLPTSGILKKVPDKPKNEFWKIRKQLNN